MDIPQSPRSPSTPRAPHRPSRAPWARLGSALLRSLEWRLGLHVLGLYRAPLRSPAPHPGSITVRALDEAHAIALGADRELEVRPEWARAAIRRGDRCLAAFEGERVVGYTWVSRQHALLDEGVDVRVGEGGEYRFKTFVRPGDRGRGLMPLLYRAADAAAAAEGRRWSCLCIAPYNEPSIAAARKAGAERMGLVVIWKFAGRVHAWRSAGVGRAGLEFHR